MISGIADRRGPPPVDRAAETDVVFIAPAPARGSVEPFLRRTIAFAAGEPVPRIGECVILSFGAEAVRWLVQDVAHVFDGQAHGIAIKLMPAGEG
ncbi:hypothetical protein [Methylobacterium nigriterrae]|uniref:hypothetical protein n=1 Tax=Methylobacterium nigriterrae TaxID=3127512 RepID=UPI00301371B7